ncbi:TonB-dependent receptor domain-containing protein [Rubrivirga sp. IMCC43871]|uniref:TonB-dependent receptor domain-containing protein n=1 Tax=Rubrivirga sp. IMCC43871 TaxID=3391575 RepID=UPI0039901F17
MRRLVLALALLAAGASAQTARVAGTVTDAETGTPVIGAAVTATVGDATTGRATDAAGRFSVAVPPGSVALQVSAVGYARLDTTLALAAGERAELALRLRPAVSGIAEVVVEARQSATATRAEAPVRLVPQAVSVLSSGVLDAQGARDTRDALRNVPSATTRASGEPGAIPVLRGFETDQTGGGVRRDGVEVPYLSDGLRANVARVEVLRGPASVLYGRLEPGGVVNFITEKPRAGRHAEAEADAGTLGTGRLAVDLGAPVGGLATRLNASVERTALREGVTGDAAFVAPALRWTRGRLLLDVDAEAERTEVGYDPGIAALGDGTDALDAVPADRTFGEPDAPRRWRSGGVFVNAAHATRPGLALRAHASVSRSVLDRGLLALDSLTSRQEIGAPLVARSLRSERLAFTYLKGAAFADARVRTGPVAHTLTVGAEAIRAWAQADGDAALTIADGTTTFAAIPPVALNAPAPTGVDHTADVPYLDASVRGLDAGAFVQDRATVVLGAVPVHVVGALRLSHVRAEATIFALADTPDAPAGVSERVASVTAATPSAGLVVEPAPGLALYVSSGASFNPVVNRVDRDGQPFRPTRGVQVEGGVKVEGAVAAASIAAFWIQKDDALTVGPGGFFEQTGRQRSRGVEAEARAQLGGVTALASYAFTDAEVIEDDNVAPGTRLPFAPRHAASVWAEATRGPVALRGGVWAQSDRTGALASTVVLPAEAVVDLGAGLALGRSVALRLDLRNVLDARGYTAARTRPGRGDGPLVVGWPTPGREARVGIVVR